MTSEKPLYLLLYFIIIIIFIFIFNIIIIMIYQLKASQNATKNPS